MVSTLCTCWVRSNTIEVGDSLDTMRSCNKWLGETRTLITTLGSTHQTCDVVLDDDDTGKEDSMSLFKT